MQAAKVIFYFLVVLLIAKCSSGGFSSSEANNDYGSQNLSDESQSGVKAADFPEYSKYFTSETNSPYHYSGAPVFDKYGYIISGTDTLIVQEYVYSPSWEQDDLSKSPIRYKDF
ncbi:MAG: hypothetical protein GXY94_03295 [Bacteroidales bacterium]|jgi:hypothetical protein|nr:hypothetical protein [Bacteroidales bacterium]